MTINREFPPLSKEGFLYMTMLANRCGVDLLDYRREAIYHRLIARLRELNISDFDTYCRRLRVDLEEELIFINLITNVTTYFFREKHHFDYLSRQVLPDLIQKKNRIRLWSAGCSTGEEPYSIAMTIKETLKNINQYDIKILATDINSDALLTAKMGIYSRDAIKKLSITRQHQWFSPLENQNSVKVNDELKELITFNRLNLMQSWPMRGSFDVIFCRNVLIYFKSANSNRIINHFKDFLEVGGVLCLGYSENLHQQRDHFRSVGKSTYIKIR